MSLFPRYFLKAMVALECIMVNAVDESDIILDAATICIQSIQAFHTSSNCMCSKFLTIGLQLFGLPGALLSVDIIKKKNQKTEASRELSGIILS